ncbi:VWD domain-containing protein [Roseovarius sp. MMSF_3281]|uniref:beta strand repeat-containing protein n=1 Tax=Roseovarius sp. MMSF_3281 TaxID=3046694 RepID=UPI00273E4D6F|nr:VWD domain-containing protein [Roseovarius sp. MMSF_3281]
MPTYSISGFQVTRNASDQIVSVDPVVLDIVTPAGQETFTYTIDNPASSGDLTEVEIEAGEAHPLAKGPGIPGGAAAIPDGVVSVFGNIETNSGSGNHTILAFEAIENDGSSVELIFQVAGDPLTYPTTVSEFEALDASITGVSDATGAWGPNTDIRFDALANTTVSASPDNVILGEEFNDTLIGTDEDDFIFTGDNDGGSFGYDYVAASEGDDDIDLSGVDTGFVELDYSALNGTGQAISADIDGAANVGEVEKGSLGTDTLIGVENPLNAGWTVGGLSLIGTQGNDSFDFTIGDEQWLNVQAGDGVDSFNVNGPGLLRFDFRDAEEGANVNFATKSIVNDGFGNSETITGNNTLWEMQGSRFDDTFTGSANGESFRSTGGNNTINAGGGFDRLRYDRDAIISVDADLERGTSEGVTATGGFGHSNFASSFETVTDTISGVEWLRGSNGHDRLAGKAGENNRFDGDGSGPYGGQDVFVYRGGDDTITDFDVLQDTLVIDLPGVDFAALEGVDPVNTPEGMVVDFGEFGSLSFYGVSADSEIHVQVNGGLNEIMGTNGNDTLNGTAGDDLIKTGDNEGGATGYDSVVASAGSDTIDTTGIKLGYVALDYGSVGAAGVDVVIDGGTNTGTVDKGGMGSDILRGIVSPLDAGARGGGLGIYGTSGDDSFDITLETSQNVAYYGEQWLSLRGGDGTDSFLLNGFGYVRLDFRDAIQGIDIDLSQMTSQIVNDGFGNTESIGGFNQVSQIQGSSHDDTFVGSGHSETYRDFGGNDNLDGGSSSYDSLRYDRDVVQSVNINGDTGEATGTLSGGGTFTDTFMNFESFRGSYGNDYIKLEDDNMSASLSADGSDGDDTLIGSNGDDSLTGGRGNDELNLVGAGDGISGYDMVAGSQGNDTIDFSGSKDDFVNLNYIGLPEPVSVTLNGVANTGTVNKGAMGTDTLVGVATPLDAGWTIGGLGLRGTFGDDSFDLTLGAEQWMSVVSGFGTDSYTLNGEGSVRLDFREIFDQGIKVDLSLSSGQIINDGFGNTETINGSLDLWEVYGTFGNDWFKGSDADESWRDNDGSDTLDGGGGFDRLRYDSIDYWGGVDIDAVEGTVTNRGEPDIVDQISNFEWFRGSDNDDRIAGDGANNLLQGGGGNDTLIGGGGEDTLEGGAGEDAFVIGAGSTIIEDFEIGTDSFDVVIDGVTEEARDLALADATAVSGGGAVVDFGNGNTLTFGNLTDSEVASLSPAPPPPPVTPIAWTVGDPHLLTLDGVGYDFHAIGEFVLLNGIAGGAFESFEIQSRMGPVIDSQGGTVPGVSANVAVAARLSDGSALMLDSTDAEPLSIDGITQTLADGGTLKIGNDSIFRDGDTYTVVFAGADGTVGEGDARLSAIVRDGRMDIGIQISEDMAGQVEGLLGDGNGNPDDDIARADGTVLERPLAYDDLYGGYRDDWRVDSEAESLFTYDTGESLAGFYDAAAPADIPDIGDFDPADVDAARDAVSNSGLEPGTLAYENAVLDFLLTDDEEFIESSSQDSAPTEDNAGSAGVLEQGETRVTINVGLEDMDGGALEGAVVNFSAGGAPILGQTGGTAGAYEIRLGSNAEAGRVNAVRDFEAGDAEINVQDALNVLRLAVNLEPSFGPASAENFIAADVTQNGAVNVTDALEVLRFAVGLDTESAPKWVFLEKDQDLSGIDSTAVNYETGTDSGDIADGLNLEMTGILLGDITAQPEA